MIKYGSQVAYLLDNAIHFGFVAAILHREDAKGETKEFIVTGIDADGNAARDKTLGEDDLIDLGAWNKDDLILGLARRSDAYKWAERNSEAILNPPDPVPQPASPTPVALSPEESAAQVALEKKEIPF